MKKILFIIPLLVLFSCDSCKTPKKATKEHEKVDDKDVLRPPEGYDNKQVQKKQKESDSLQEVQNKAARPFPCVTVERVDSVTVTQNTATISWPSYGGINKYFIYKSLTQGQTGFYDGQASSNSYTGSGLAPGASVYYTVAAVGRGNKVCGYSPQIRMTTSGVVQPPNPPPTGGQINLALLMFDPITITGTSWGSNIVSPGANITEDQKLAVFEHMKAIYAKDHPRLSFTMDKAVYDAADPTSRGMVVYTSDASWYGTAGGVAFINSFGRAPDNISWVFTQLLNYSTRNIGLADIHELGHMLGLYHTVTDTVCSLQYGISVLCRDGLYRAPIMGGSYTDYEHIFYTPAKGSLYGILWKQKNDCAPHDEDAIIEAHLK